MALNKHQAPLKDGAKLPSQGPPWADQPILVPHVRLILGLFTSDKKSFAARYRSPKWVASSLVETEIQEPEALCTGMTCIHA